MNKIRYMQEPDEGTGFDLEAWEEEMRGRRGEAVEEDPDDLETYTVEIRETVTKYVNIQAESPEAALEWAREVVLPSVDMHDADGYKKEVVGLVN